MIIPASEKHEIPGADDATILATIITKGAAHQALIKKGLEDFKQLAQSQQKTALELDDNELFSLLDLSLLNLSLLDNFRQAHKPFTQVLMTITAQSYYQDARVLKSLDMEPRPPYPQGHVLEQGDWSLLDPVKNKEKLYREVPGIE